jgi:hypothetical protein
MVQQFEHLPSRDEHCAASDHTRQICQPCQTALRQKWHAGTAGNHLTFKSGLFEKRYYNIDFATEERCYICEEDLEESEDNSHLPSATFVYFYRKRLHGRSRYCIMFMCTAHAAEGCEDETQVE